MRPGASFSTLAGEAEDEDVIVKIDSDTLLLSGGWILDMQRNGLSLHASGYQVPGHPSERSAYGTCYAISGRAARLAAEELMQADIPALAPEDLTICRTIQGLFPQERIRLDEPWTPFNREGKWTAWNWFSIAVTPKKLRRILDGHLRQPAPYEHSQIRARPRHGRLVPLPVPQGRRRIILLMSTK